MALATCLSEKSRMVLQVGPNQMIPAAVMASQNASFSERKPYPGWRAVHLCSTAICLSQAVSTHNAVTWECRACRWIFLKYELSVLMHTQDSGNSKFSKSSYQLASIVWDKVVSFKNRWWFDANLQDCIGVGVTSRILSKVYAVSCISCMRWQRVNTKQTRSVVTFHLNYGHAITIEANSQNDQITLRDATFINPLGDIKCRQELQ
jgi:ribosomal protein L37AE/L43A